MPRKTPGKLPAPPAAEVFARFPLRRLCRELGGVYHRIHPRDPATGKPWEPVFFGRRGTTRFDPPEGLGTLCLADSLAGAILEMFGDRLEPLGSFGRGLSSQMLGDWFVTLISVRQAVLFEASGPNLSKLGVDLQLLAGDHTTARQWALRLMQHPAAIGGIVYPSRHDNLRRNVALFKRPGLLPARPNAQLLPPITLHAPRGIGEPPFLVFGPAICLREHPELPAALRELEVAVLP